MFLLFFEIREVDLGFIGRNRKRQRENKGELGNKEG